MRKLFLILCLSLLSLCSFGQIQMLLASDNQASFSPTDLENCEVWLKSDAGINLTGSDLTIWEDQSGNGHDVTSGKPPEYGVTSLNGYESIRFNGVDELLTTYPSTVQIANISTGGYTAFAVFTPAAVGNRSVLDSDDGSGNRVSQLIRMNATNFITIAFNTSSSAFSDNGNTVTSGTNYIAHAICTGTSTEIFSNGSGNGSTAITGTAENSAAALTIGRRTNATSQFFSGDIYEIIIYSRDLDAGEIIEVLNYLNTKYSIY